MIARVVEQNIARQEKQLGESMDYLRDIAAASPAAFLKFGAFAPLSRHRGAASREALAVARLVATRSEDCGPCLQLVANFALAEGVAPEVVRAALDGNVEALPAPLDDIHCFAVAVTRQEPRATVLSEELTGKLGRAVVVDLALAIASVRVFPTVKRALGYAQSCSLAPVEI